jgi:hypothetical protein
MIPQRRKPQKRLKTDKKEPLHAIAHHTETGVQDIDSCYDRQHISRTAAAGLIPAKVLYLQQVIGNQGFQRYLQTRGEKHSSEPAIAPTHQRLASQAHGAVLQRALPAINLPQVKAPLVYPTQLITLANAYMQNTLDETKARALCNAAAAWLEGRGMVNYRGQNDIVPGSPEFLKRPSLEAENKARQSGISLTSTAGFTYLYDTVRGRTRFKVEIYHPDAFQGDSAKELIGFLSSVITHEYIHILQNRRGGAQTNAQREFQAYLWQAEQALRMGIRPSGDAAGKIVTQLEIYYKKLTRADRRTYANRYRRAYRALQSP